MADDEPLLGKVSLGTLRPFNGAAEVALKAVPPGTVVKFKIVKTVGNTKRLAFYWVMLKLTLDNLDDAFDGPMTTKALHRWLKREYGLAVPIRSHKTGEIIDWDYDSISFAAMPENERSAFIDWVTETLSRRLGVDGATLRHEAEQAA